MADQLPYRVVDRHNQGWHSGPDERGGVRYVADYGFMRNLPDQAYAQLAATRGPLRPVEPITGSDQAALRHLFRATGRKTITTVAAALEAVFHRLREDRGGLANAHYSYELARRTMIAGREGSWESELLIEVVMFGNGLNLGAPGAAGPSRRVDVGARAQMAAMFWRWVTAPDRYTEVAETLAQAVSSYCDDRGGGWAAVADQWLQPGGLAQHDFSVCYRLFYSLSAHYDTGVI